jgi:hypothetical protein
VRTSGSEAEELAVGKNSGEQLREVTQVLQGADVLEAVRPFETSGRLKIECKGAGSVNSRIGQYRRRNEHQAILHTQEERIWKRPENIDAVAGVRCVPSWVKVIDYGSPIRLRGHQGRSLTPS